MDVCTITHVQCNAKVHLGNTDEVNSIFSGPVTSIFNAIRFDENLFTCQCEKED